VIQVTEDLRMHIIAAVMFLVACGLVWYMYWKIQEKERKERQDPDRCFRDHMKVMGFDVGKKEVVHSGEED